MPTPFTISLSPNYKPTFAKHRKWKGCVLGNGESWPRIFGSNIASSSDFYRLGLIPAYNLATVTTTSSGTSTADTYGLCIVYRTTGWVDGTTGLDVQSNRSNIIDVTLTATQAAVLTRVASADSKVTYIDIYAAIKVNGVYGEFYRVVKDCANNTSTVTFNIQSQSGLLIGAGVTNGTADTTYLTLATDNDYPYAQPILLQVNGILVSMGGIVKTVTGTFTNGSATVTTTETIYDGIEFWYIKRDGDTSGGADGKGTYLCRYATANTVTLVDATGTAVNYAGTSGSGTTVIYTEPNRRYSKLANPHAFPSDNVNNDYPSAILAGGIVPNSNRVLIFGVDWVIAEDYDRLPIASGLNYISTEYGCSSPHSVVQAAGRLFWLDLGRNKRNILMSDGSSVAVISTQKIKTILDRVTKDVNGDPWRVSFIAGSYFKDEEVVRWGLYLDDSTVANYVLELDLITGDVRSDPQFYPHRYLDAFTYGNIRGKNYIGQFGWTGGIARLGIDNTKERYADWVDTTGSTFSGSLATSGHTYSTFTIASGSLQTGGDGLKGIQALIWQELDSDGNHIANRTYYHCRISTNTATTFTVNYVETMTAGGEITGVDYSLPVTPSGTGWQYAIGVIQSIIGPKWFNLGNQENPATVRDITVLHKGQDVTSGSPVVALGFENLDTTPREAQVLQATQQGEQVADTTLTAASFVLPKTNPANITGFALHDNNVHPDQTTALEIEEIVINFNDQITQGSVK